MQPPRVYPLWLELPVPQPAPGIGGNRHMGHNDLEGYRAGAVQEQSKAGGNIPLQLGICVLIMG